MNWNPVKPKSCLRPKCKAPAHTRGLCKSDYAMALRLVNTRKTTWAKLEKKGKATSPKRTFGATEWLIA